MPSSLDESGSGRPQGDFPTVEAMQLVERFFEIGAQVVAIVESRTE